MLFKKQPRRRFPYKPIFYKPPEEQLPEDRSERLRIRRLVVHERSNNLLVLLGLLVIVMLLIAYLFPEVFSGFRELQPLSLDTLDIVL